MNWPKISGSVQRTFEATHALVGVTGGSEEPHSHRYAVRFGFIHEVPPSTGLAGSKALADWSRDIDGALRHVDGGDLNLTLAPYPPTIEVLAMRLLSLMPAYFEWVEVSAYEPLYTVRVDRRGLRIEWPEES